MALTSWVYDVPVIVVLITIEDALTVAQVIRAYWVVQLHIELNDILNWRLLCLLLHEVIRRVLRIEDLTWRRLVESATWLTMMKLLLMAVQRVQRLQLLLNLLIIQCWNISTSCASLLSFFRGYHMHARTVHILRPR